MWRLRKYAKRSSQKLADDISSLPRENIDDSFKNASTFRQFVGHNRSRSAENEPAKTFAKLASFSNCGPVDVLRERHRAGLVDVDLLPEALDTRRRDVRNVLDLNILA